MVRNMPIRPLSYMANPIAQTIPDWVLVGGPFDGKKVNPVGNPTFIRIHDGHFNTLGWHTYQRIGDSNSFQWISDRGTKWIILDQ